MRKNNQHSILNRSTVFILFLALLGISNLFAITGFIWSVLPIPMQTSTIQLPDTYSIGLQNENYQFPLKRELMVSYPERIRFGDIQEMRLIITPKIDPLKCDEFCQEKHLMYENVWSAFKVNMVFSFDLNNIMIEPMGETIYPLAKSAAQEFAWKIKAVSDNSAYLKNTIYLQFVSFENDEKDAQLVFARELTIPVKKVGPVSFPIFRVICIVWVLTSVLWLLLNHRKLKDYKRSKMM